MSTIGSYTTRAFSETQKFLVLDPTTSSTSLVAGSDLVAYITPSLNSVLATTTRTAAQNEDYEVGTVIQTTGATAVGDNLASVFLVVPAGQGDFPMLNGNELLVIAGDDFLRQQLASSAPGEGSDLVAYTGTAETVTEALDKRLIRVSSRTEMKTYDVPAGYQFSLEEGGRSGIFVVKSGTPPSDPQEGIYVALANGNYAERIEKEFVFPGWFGAIGDETGDGTGADDFTALNAAIVYCRANQVPLYLPANSGFKISQTLKTQTDGTFVELTILGIGEGREPTIWVDFDLSPGLLVEGGSARQTLGGFTVRPTATYERDGTGTNIDVSSHGVVYSGTRVSNPKWLYTVKFKGHGLVIDSVGNANTSEFMVEARDSNRGINVQGTQDDLAVCIGQFRAFGNAASGFYSSSTTKIRNWETVLYAESNCVADTSAGGVYMGSSEGCFWTIYCEQSSTTREVWFDGTTANNRIRSLRANKDLIDGTNNVTVRGGIIAAASTSDQNTLIDLYSPNFSTGTLNTWNQIRFSAVGGSMGFVRGTEDSVRLLSADELNYFKVNNDYHQFNANHRKFSNGITLTSGSPSTSILLLSSVTGNQAMGSIKIAGRAAGGAGFLYYKADFFINNGALTVQAPTADSATANVTYSLNVDGSNNLVLDLSYVPGAYGGTYYFIPDVDFTFV